MIPLIALEEHFFASHIQDWSGYGYGEQFKHLPNVVHKLLDLDTTRIELMDKNSIAMQLLSHAPGLCVGADPISDCQKANNQMYAATQRHPTRFAALAVLPMSKPEAAAQELSRCVKEMGFRGALIDNHVQGHHYEGKAYHVFWKMAESTLR